MNTIRKFVLAITLLASVTSALAESFLCVPDMATGFVFDKNRREWTSANFSVKNKKYVLRKPNAGTSVLRGSKWGVFQLGIKDPVAWCDEDFSSSGILVCRALTGEFNFDKGNLRFLVANVFGYWNDDLTGRTKLTSEGTNTPFLEIGKCNRLE